MRAAGDFASSRFSLIFVDFCKRTLVFALDSYSACNSAKNAALDVLLAAHIAENGFS